MQEGIDSQVKLYMSIWHGLGTSGRIKDKPSGQNLFCTLDKNNLPMVIIMLHFPEPQNSPILVFLVAWREHKRKIQSSTSRRISTWVPFRNKPPLICQLLRNNKINFLLPNQLLPPKESVHGTLLTAVWVTIPHICLYLKCCFRIEMTSY